MTSDSDEATSTCSTQKLELLNRARNFLMFVCAAFGAACLITGGEHGGWFGLIAGGAGGAFFGIFASLIFISITNAISIFAVRFINAKWLQYILPLPIVIATLLVFVAGSRTVERGMKENRMVPVEVHFERCVAKKWKPEYDIPDEFTSPERIRQIIEKECLRDAKSRSWMD